MRITKEIAKEVALKLTEAKLTEIEDLKTERSNFVTAIYESIIPEEVKSTFAKYPGYFDTTTYKRVNGEGISAWSSYNLTKKLPDSDFALSLDAKQANALVKFDNDITDRDKKYYKIVKEIEVALFALRTYKNVESEFPEAFPHLPISKQSTAVMINISSIRNELKA